MISTVYARMHYRAGDDRLCESGSGQGNRPALVLDL